MAIDLHDLDLAVVARRVLKNLVDSQLGELHEMYPEVGEYDWDQIDTKAQELVDSMNPEPDVFEAAYRRLDLAAQGWAQRHDAEYDESEVVQRL